MFSFIANSEVNQDVFFGTAGTGTVTDWQIWKKPTNTNYISFTIIGGGGGGGGKSFSGGGGGGSGGITRIIIPSIFTPDVLYMRIGAGGAGGTTNTNGDVGQPTYVSVNRSTSVAYVLGYANGGSAGFSNGTSGGGALQATINNMPLACPFHYQIRAGYSGTSGSSTIPSSITAAYMLSGGAGGSSNDLGGQIAGQGIIPTILGGTGTTNGGNGVWFWKGLKGCGGAGAGYNSAGAGGNGAYGCGGGGGGIKGGNGGNGLVIIQYW